MPPVPCTSSVSPERIPPRVTRPCHAVTAAHGNVAASTDDRCAGTATSAPSGRTTYSASIPSAVLPPSAEAMYRALNGPEIQIGGRSLRRDPIADPPSLISEARPHRHPELTEQTVWEAFEAERPKLVPDAGRFDGFHAVPASVSKTCRVRFDNNKYSVVTASAVGRPVEVHAYADRIVIRQDGRIVAEHPRSFGRGETTYDPWHHVLVLARKPGALRNGAPFKDWVLPAAIQRVRLRLAGADDGNRQMVDILNAVLTDGLPAVEAACAEAIAHGVHSADVVLNILARQRILHRQPTSPLRQR